MFQYDIKLLCNLYTSAGYIFKNLQILINNVLVSCTTASTFRMTKDGEEYMFDFYKWPISENDFAKLRILAAIFKENRLRRKTKVSRESRKLIKIVHFREIFYFKGNMKCCIYCLSGNWYTSLLPDKIYLKINPPMRAEGFLLSILLQQVPAVEQSWLRNKSSLQKNRIVMWCNVLLLHLSGTLIMKYWNN